MGTFGQFESAGELARSTLAELLLARPADGSAPGRFVIKHRRAQSALDGTDPAQAASRFLEAVATQRAMRDSPFWAPIHDAGAIEGGAYYVTDRYELHAGQLINGCVHLGEARLLALVRSITSGLIDLEKAEGRPHGNLKPTNVLLARSGRSERLRAVLTDPLATSQLREERDAKRDLRAIGELIYGLVTHREYAGDAAWPIERDGAWASLGKGARTWSELCNALLAPAEVGAERMTLAELDESLGQLARQRQRQRLPLAGAGAAALLLLLVVAACGARLALRKGPCEISASTARRELGEIAAAVAGGGDLRDLDERLGVRPDAYSCLPGIGELAGTLRSLRDAHRRILDGLDVARGAETLQFFLSDHQGGERRPLSDDQICAIHRAYLELQSIQETLSRFDHGPGPAPGGGLQALLGRFDNLVAIWTPAQAPRPWKDEMRRRSNLFAAPALDEALRRGLAEVAGLSTDEQLQASLCLYLLRREQALGIESVLRLADDQVARRVTAARIPGGIPGGPARELLRRWLSPELGAITSSLDWRAIVQAPDVSALGAARRALEQTIADPLRWRACEQRIAGGEELFADLALAQAALASGRGLDAEIPALAGRDVRTVRQLYARWAGRAELQDFRKLLEGVEGDVAALRQLFNDKQLRP